MKNRPVFSPTPLALAGCLALALLVYWLATRLEYYEEIADLGWSAKARRNPYLAAEQFLSGAGLEVTSTESLASLSGLPAQGTLFISNSNQVLGHRHLRELLDWVERGGHLIVAAHSYDVEHPDPLLSYFEVSLEPTDCGCEQAERSTLPDSTQAPDESAPNLPRSNEDPAREQEQEQEQEQTLTPEQIQDPAQTPAEAPTLPADETNDEDLRPRKLSEILRESNRETRERNRKAKAGADDAGDSSPQGVSESAGDRALAQEKRRETYQASIPPKRLTRLAFDDLTEELTVYFSPYQGLTHPSLYDQDSLFKPLYWSGSDYGFHFMQFDLGEGLLSVLSDASIWHSHNIDKFDHAHLLTVLTGFSREVVLLYGGEYPSLWQGIKQNAPELPLALALWLTAWLIYRARRFGPVQHPQVTTRRSMAEHIYACADYLWRQDHQQQLLDSVRADTLRRIQLRHPAFNRLDRNAQIRLLSEHTQLTADEIQAALFAAAPKHEIQFTRAIALLQTLMRQKPM